MTPFMARVAELIGAGPAGRPEPVSYRTRPSAWTAANAGADRHIALRALAEQLMCEANAVLADYDDHMTLSDETGGTELAFSVFYRNRAVRMSTRFADGAAFGQLTGDGIEPGPARELDGPQAVADLLAAVLVSAGLPMRQATR